MSSACSSLKPKRAISAGLGSSAARMMRMTSSMLSSTNCRPSSTWTDPQAKQAAEFISAEASFGRAFFLPPNVPADRVALLRKAFEATIKDPELIADAKKKNLPLEPTSWEELTKLTGKVIATPKEVAALAK